MRERGRAIERVGDGRWEGEGREILTQRGNGGGNGGRGKWGGREREGDGRREGVGESEKQRGRMQDAGRVRGRRGR